MTKPQTPPQTPSQTPIWKTLESLASENHSTPIKDLFDQNDKRFEQYSLQVGNLCFDYSKNAINDDVFKALIALAHEANISQWRDKMLAGEPINLTENRAVLHTALRNRSSAPVWVKGQDVMPDIRSELAKMQDFVTQIRQGQWTGYTGKTITDVVSIGIGGSDLGPRMVCQALADYADNTLKIHFVSNVDGSEISHTLRPLNPERTLFIVASKTFTTQETMTNANTARKWLINAAGNEQAVAKHFVAVSTNLAAIEAFGIDRQNSFTLWDWVGGRFSLWSVIGLPIALYLGFDHFEALLTGAYEMDVHFTQAPLEANAPVLLALIGIWNRNFLGYEAQAILPYDWSLAKLPAYLQQAEMESNGKSVNQQGDTLNYGTGSIIWGQLGIDGQHAFYQFLHQSPTTVPADFIGSINSNCEVGDHHHKLMANFFAQSQALMKGITAAEVEANLQQQSLAPAQLKALIPHKVHPGNRPTNTILMDKLTPHNLGALIALYEHKIFVQGIIWNICSFDQWGVELGKTLANTLLPTLTNESDLSHLDSSTAGLIAYYKAHRS